MKLGLVHILTKCQTICEEPTPKKVSLLEEVARKGDGTFSKKKAVKDKYLIMIKKLLARIGITFPTAQCGN